MNINKAILCMKFAVIDLKTALKTCEGHSEFTQERIKMAIAELMNSIEDYDPNWAYSPRGEIDLPEPMITKTNYEFVY